MSDETGTSGGGNPLATQSGDTLVMWGALIVLGVWIVFEVIVEEYFLSTTTAALAILMVALPRIDAAAITSLSRPASFAKLAGYLLVCLGIVELVGDLRNNIFDAGGSTILGGLVAYAGFAITYMGARKIEV